MDDLTKKVMDAFNIIDPLYRYPAMVKLAQILANELPKAEREHNKVRREMLKEFLQMFGGENDD